MSKSDKIIQSITDFVKGGDNRDLMLLDKVLHAQFRVTNNGYGGKPGVTIIDKQTYLFNIQSGIFGGLARKMNIEIMDESDTIAMVKLRLESAENYFVSYNSVILDIDHEWKLINNLAVVKPRK